MTSRVGRWKDWAKICIMTVLTVLLPSWAWGEGPEPAVIAPPRDVPMVLEPSSVHIPGAPSTYQSKNMGWLTLVYPPSAHERVQPIVNDAEEIKARLADELGQPVLERVEVRIGRNSKEMAELAPRELPPPAYASGVAYPPLHLVILSLTAPGGVEAVDIAEVFRHELSHIALDDAVLGHHVPRWFNEGLAVHESGESRLLRVRTLWDATLSKTVLPLSDLDRGFPEDNYRVSVAYAESADFVRFLLRDSDRARFSSLVDRVRTGEAFDASLSDAYGSDVRKLEFQWREEIAKRYTFLPVLTGGSLLWVLVIGMLVMGWVKKRRRDRATLARWEREEAALDLPSAAATGEAGEIPQPAPVHPEALRLPKIEHEGGWHTLH